MDKVDELVMQQDICEEPIRGLAGGEEGKMQLVQAGTLSSFLSQATVALVPSREKAGTSRVESSRWTLECDEGGTEHSTRRSLAGRVAAQRWWQ